MNDAWPFQDPKNVAVFTTKAIIEGTRSIRIVTHDEDDGAWQFLDGQETDEQNARIVGLSEIVRIDPSVMCLADLPEGWMAERDGLSSTWKRTRKHNSEQGGGGYGSPGAGSPSPHR